MHECPKTDCQQIIPDNFIACLDHWFRLPKETREKVEVAAGKVPFAYREAVREAIDALSRPPEGDEPRILWQRGGTRCVRYGTESDGFTRFESALYDDAVTIVDWQEVTASQVGFLLGVLGEHFDEAVQIVDAWEGVDTYATR